MIIQRWNNCYEVIRQINSTDRMAEFLCIEQKLQEMYLLVRVTDAALAERFTLFLEDRIKGTKFSDYKECFQSDGVFYALFGYSGEKKLEDKLGRETYTVKERAEIVRRLLEQMLLRSPHPYFMRNSLSPGMITVADNLDVDWNYHLDESGIFDNCTMETVCEQLAQVIDYLFALERKREWYPPLNEYLLSLEGGEISDYLQMYQDFMPVYEALCDKESGRLPRSCLQRLWERLSKIVGRPGSLKGYFRFGKRYIAKKLVLVLTLFILLLPLLFVRFVYPWLQARSEAQKQDTVPTMVMGSQDVEGYTGQVRLVGDLEADNVIYVGTLLEGEMDGQGTLYDPEGNLLYQGEFAKNQFEGTGRLYSEAGAVIYDGEFSKGLYEGTGVLFYESGVSSYAGQFAKGLYEGTGVLFYKNGVTSYQGEFLQGKKSGNGREFDKSGELLYAGNFLRDRYEGEGILYNNGQTVRQGTFHRGLLTSGSGSFYDKQGNLRYQGSIVDGMYDGQGRFFSEGILIYEGGFAKGNYHGSGKMYQRNTGILLYDGMFDHGRYAGEGRLYDEETGGLLYEGSFYQSLYDGTGKLYDPIEGYLIYEGGFREGQFDGQGKIYDLGILVYEGEFLLGAYNGRGMLYDLATGTVVFDGVFYDNQPLTEYDYPQEAYPQEEDCLQQEEDYMREEDYPQEENYPQQEEGELG